MEHSRRSDKSVLKEKIYLICGIGTDIGKTFFVEKLCHIFSDSKAIKPVVSGFSDDDLNSDPAKILAAMQLEINQENLDKISPWRFKDPVSPHFAGNVDYEELVKFCQNRILDAKKNKQFLFIESAGGIMSPITYEKTFVDLALNLEIPVLLVSSNYLGAISHTLTAIEVLKKRGVNIEKVILNENFPSKTAANDLVKTIENFSKIEVVTMTDFFNSKP
jgi:dethiobiotin synthetase